MATDAPVLAVTRAIAKDGDVRRGHGLEVRFEGVRVDPAPFGDFKIDVIGPAFRGLRPAYRMLAQALLPFAVHRMSAADVIGACAREWSSSSFTLGALKLSHRTRDELLRSLRDEGGDPLFLVELTCRARDGTGSRRALAQIPTRPSLIIASIASGGAASIVAPEGATPALLAAATRRRRRAALAAAWAWFRWWLFPSAFCALNWMLLVARAPTLARLAPARGLLFRSRAALASGSAASSSIFARARLAPVPESLSAAFELGAVSARVAAAESARARAALLATAAALVGRPDEPLTLDELASVAARLAELEAHRGAIARVRGAFTLVNVVWLLAIAGVAVSFGPSLLHVLRPIRDALERLARWVLREVIEPCAVRLHRWGAFEAACWGACGALVIDGAAVFGRDTGGFIAATGAALATPAFAYSTLLHAAKLDRSDREAFAQLVNGWAALALAPLAISYDSALAAYLATFAAYAVLGFSGACYGLCYCVGFRSERAVERCAAASALLLAARVAAHEYGPALLAAAARRLGVGAAAALPRAAVFASPVAVVGALTLYLALLITSSYYYRPDRRGARDGRFGDRFGVRYTARNALMLTSVLLGVGAGALIGAPGLTNTAITFLYLWCFEKYTEVHLEAEWNGWVLVLITSLLAYKGSLWAHDNPAVVASLFGGDA